MNTPCTTSLKEFEKMLLVHDWFYDQWYNPDFKLSHNEAVMLKNISKSSKDHQDLYIQHRKINKY